MEMLYLLVIIAVIVCATAIKCFNIKYSGVRETEKLRLAVAALDKKLEGIDTESIKDLKVEVKSLRNHYGLVSRK